MPRIPLRGAWLRLRQTPAVDLWVAQGGPSARRVPLLLRGLAVAQGRLESLPGVQAWRLGPEEVVTPQAPAMPEGEGARLLPLALRPRRLQPPFVAQAERAWLVGRQAVPFTSTGQMLLAPFLDRLSVMGHDEHPDVLRWAQAQGWSREPRVEEAEWDGEEVCSLVGRLDSNFFHWIVDACGQLEALGLYRERTGSEPKVLIRAASPPFVRQSLQVLGVDPSRLLEWPLDWRPRPGEAEPGSDAPTVARRVGKLVVSSWRGHQWGPSPRSLRWLRSAFLSGAGIASPTPEPGQSSRQPGRKIYLHRAPGSWRSVENDDEVLAFLTSRGFEAVHPESLSLREQIALAASASVLVAMHGAALTSILFAHRAGIVELIGSYGGGDYLFMAQGLGNKFRRVACEDRGQNIAVDIRRLGDAIESVE